MITVPTEKTEQIIMLMSIIGSHKEPVYVTCRPSKKATKNECFPQVEAKVNAEGGEQIIGWQIWQGPLLLEAEFHSVWKTPAGELVDITPKTLPFERILFIEDPEAVYEGKQVNNLRINLLQNTLIDDYISVLDTIFRIENKGERAFQHNLTLMGNEANAHHQLNAVKLALEIMALYGSTRSSQCFCGGEKQYKDCHGQLIKNLTNDF